MTLWSAQWLTEGHRRIINPLLCVGNVVLVLGLLVPRRQVDINVAALATGAARMLEHALDDTIGAPSVLGDLFEIAGQQPDDLIDLGALILVERG
jgi:hypothetical protein